MLAVAEDRERIARDLHDTVIQRLFAEGMSLQAAIAVLMIRNGPGPGSNRSSMGSMRRSRSCGWRCSPSKGAASAPGGLRGRLLQVVTEATDGLGFEPRLQFDGPIETMDVHITDHLMPVLREALSNIAHHAHAGHVRVAVSVAADVTLTMSDDGIGVPPEVLGGRGLINIANGPEASEATSPSAPNFRRFPPRVAGAGPTVTPAGMTDAPRLPVRRVLLRAG